ncbi:MAG: PorV/PorQ family protein [bacterium]
MRRIFCFCLILIGNCFADKGESAAPFLKIGISPRASALGNAYVGLSESPSSIYYNPAGLSQSKTKEITLMHNMYFEGINHEFLGYIHPLNKQTLGFGITGLFTDSIPRKTRATLENEGSFKASDYCLILSGGQRIKKNTLGGLSIKIIHQELDKEKGTGIGMDLGLLILRPSMKIGLSLQNIGPKMKIYKEEFSLPSLFSFGISLTKNRFLFTSDIKKPLLIEKKKVANYLL